MRILVVEDEPTLVEDPDAAHEWRTRLRAQKEGLLGSGLTLAGFDVDKGYLFTA